MKVKAILETCLYASDLAAIETFYKDILGLDAFSKREGRSVFSVAVMPFFYISILTIRVKSLWR